MGLKEELSQFTGTENYFMHPIPCRPRLVYTDGVKYLAQQANAYWLLDAIASYQNDERITGNEMLREIQFWNLRRWNGGAILTCVEDSGRRPVITQDIEYSDFPLDKIELWVELGSLDGTDSAYVLMLPSER